MDNILVAYFSATGTTKKLAEKLAKVTGADLHEVKPKVVYTSTDLNWMDKNSRSSREMKDKSFRPEVENTVDNIDKYNIIYVAFPIWWYVAPTIINSFLEKYNLEGCTIIPIATSGGSSMGKTNKGLEASCKGAILKEGKVFSANVSENDLKIWVSNIVK